MDRDEETEVVLMGWLQQVTWSPYIVGAGIGVLSWLTFLLLDKPLGCSTAFAKTSGMIEGVFRGDKARQRPYFKKVVPKVDWQWMLVVGIVLGALVSALLSGDFGAQWVPSRWEMAFGGSRGLRLGAAVGGGVLMGFGARWAGGCTSGHGISGTLQMAVSGWLAAVSFFVCGIAMALLLFRVMA